MKNNLPKLIFWLFFISFWLGFLVFQYTNKSTDHVIYITKNGFIPDKITLNKNDSITWVNTDIRLHWPSSNSHPTHTEYKTDVKGCIGSALDACRGLKKGDSYSFTFDKEGVFGMHDHLLPARTMIIEVVNRGQMFTLARLFNLNRVRETKVPPSPQDFYELDYEQKRALIIALAQKDPRSAWTFLKKAAIDQDAIVDSVHELAHITGSALYSKYGFDGISSCSKEFLYGCYHGAISEALVDQGIKNIPIIEATCMDILNKNGGDIGECMHGLGHGLLSIYDLDIVPSLAACDLLKGELHKGYCYQGVFMEVYLNGSKLEIDRQNPWNFCNQFLIQYQTACAAYLPFIFGNNKNYDIIQGWSICKDAPTDTLSRQCKSSISVGITANSRGNLQSILRDCRELGDEEDQAYCVILGSAWVKRLEFKNSSESAKMLCEELPANFLNQCLSFRFL